jgi:hypothetical protein
VQSPTLAQLRLFVPDADTEPVEQGRKFVVRLAGLVHVRFVLLALTGAVLVLSGCGSSSPPTPHTTHVPNVVGTSVGRAWAILFRDGFCVTKITTVLARPSSRGSDRIVRQLPKAGVRVSTPGTVTLVDQAHPSATGSATATAPLVQTRGKGLDCPPPVETFSGS